MCPSSPCLPSGLPKRGAQLAAHGGAAGPEVSNETRRGSAWQGAHSAALCAEDMCHEPAPTDKSNPASPERLSSDAALAKATQPAHVLIRAFFSAPQRVWVVPSGHPSAAAGPYHPASADHGVGHRRQTDHARGAAWLAGFGEPLVFAELARTLLCGLKASHTACQSAGSKLPVRSICFTQQMPRCQGLCILTVLLLTISPPCAAGGGAAAGAGGPGGLPHPAA